MNRCIWSGAVNDIQTFAALLSDHCTALNNGSAMTERINTDT